MSAETMEWLNTNTLIGYTEMRGNAWSYIAALQGSESNHYPGAIPVDDVLRRLFNFTVESSPIHLPDGRVIEGRQAMVTSDTGEVLGIFKDGYQGHGFEPWLLDTVATILGDDLQIGSAGLLKNRAQAWVSVEMPENVSTPEGVTFRPHLLACTSFDGTIATQYGRKVTLVVCDNTLAAARGENGQVYKVKHTRHSAVKIHDAREALAIVYTMADDFSAEVKRLTNWEVTEKHFDKMLDVMIPVPADADNKRGITVAETKRDDILRLYRADERCSPWQGTAFGVLQAFNTWNTHESQVRKGISRVQRKMENVVSGKFDAADDSVLSALATITKYRAPVAA